MKKVKLGIIFMVICISIFLLNGYFSNLHYETINIQMVDRNNFNFFPYPIIKNDAVSVELVEGKGLKMDEDGNIALEPEQIINFKNLDSARAKIVPLNDWPISHLAVDSVSDGGMNIYINLASHNNRYKSFTSYEFRNDKLKILIAKKEIFILSRIYQIGYLLLLFLAFGLILLIWGLSEITKLKKYSFLESHNGHNKNEDT